MLGTGVPDAFALCFPLISRIMLDNALGGGIVCIWGMMVLLGMMVFWGNGDGITLFH